MATTVQRGRLFIFSETIAYDGSSIVPLVRGHTSSGVTKGHRDNLREANVTGAFFTCRTSSCSKSTLQGIRLRKAIVTGAFQHVPSISGDFSNRDSSKVTSSRQHRRITSTSSRASPGSALQAEISKPASSLQQFCVRYFSAEVVIRRANRI